MNTPMNDLPPDHKRSTGTITRVGTGDIVAFYDCVGSRWEPGKALLSIEADLPLWDAENAIAERFQLRFANGQACEFVATIQRVDVAMRLNPDTERPSVRTVMLCSMVVVDRSFVHITDVGPRGAQLH